MMRGVLLTNSPLRQELPTQGYWFGPFIPKLTGGASRVAWEQAEKHSKYLSPTYHLLDGN